MCVVSWLQKIGTCTKLYIFGNYSQTTILKNLTQMLSLEIIWAFKNQTNELVLNNLVYQTIKAKSITDKIKSNNYSKLILNSEQSTK